MKTYVLILSFMLTVSSCSDNNDESQIEDLASKTLPQEWRLYKMTGSLQGSETTGNQMEWQEKYRFYPDSTFSKTRIRNNKTTTITGSFTTYIDGKEKGILLNYKEYSPIIGSCTSEFKEYLSFDNKEDILYSNWWACDGPGLFYRKD